MKLSLVAADIFLNHLPSNKHAESPDRIAGWQSKLQVRPGWELSSPRKITEKEVLSQHSKVMWQQLMDCRGSRGWFDPDTYYGEKSIDVALSAAGACIDQALDIWHHRQDRGFALVRPPGHHAVFENPMGFCLLNNVALSVAALKNESPQARIAIVDFDLHHGNGTQAAFINDPNVLFLSSHRYPYYPGTGGLRESGEGAAKGTTVNLPLDRAYDSEFFESLYLQIGIPVLKAFAPDMIVVSAGFDGHQLDPMQGLAIETKTFSRISESLIQLANEMCAGRIQFCLEGGYNPLALEECVTEVLRQLENESPIQALATKDDPLIEEFRLYHQQFFPGL